MQVGRLLPLPIERIGDVSAHFRPPGYEGKPGFDAWVHGAVEQDKYISHIRDTGEVTAEITGGLAFWTDVANIMHARAVEEDPHYMKQDDERQPLRQERIDEIFEQYPNARVINSILEGEQSFSNDELIGIVEAHFGALEAFLRTGDARKSFWSENIEYVRNQVGEWREAQDLGALIRVGNFFDEQEAEPQHGKRMNIVARKMGMLYAEFLHIGRAIALLAVMDDREEIEQLMNAVVDGMHVGKSEYGDEYYQKDFAYAKDMLPEDTFDMFRAMSQPVRIPEIDGAVGRYELWGKKLVLIESWDEETPITAATLDGSRIELPFTEYRTRAITDQGLDSESSMYDRRFSVLMDELDDTLRSRVEQKLVDMNSETEDASIAERDEVIERLVFGFGFSLLTMDVSNGVWDIMPTINPRQITDEKLTSGEVREIEEVGEMQWMITPSNDSYIQYEEFTHDDLVRIAPEGANAFWPVATPRVVRKSRRQIDNMDKRVVVTPIKFYRITK